MTSRFEWAPGDVIVRRRLTLNLDGSLYGLGDAWVNQPRDEEGQFASTGGAAAVNARLDKESAEGIGHIERHMEKALSRVPKQKEMKADEGWDGVDYDTSNTVMNAWKQDQYENGVDVDTSNLDEEIIQELRDDEDKQEEIIADAEKRFMEHVAVVFPDKDPALPLGDPDKPIALMRQLDPDTIEVGEDDGDGAPLLTENLRFIGGEELTDDEKKGVAKSWGYKYEEAFDHAREREFESDDYYSRKQELEEKALDVEWSEMDDSDKFAYGVEHDLIEAPPDDEDEDDDDDADNPGKGDGKLPSKWVVDEGESSDYARTRDVARQLAMLRTEELLKERGLVSAEAHSQHVTNVAQSQTEIWGSWKHSSSSVGGNALQVAAAEELGGVHQFSKEERDDVVSKFGEQRFNELKAYTRAQWETTQYVMHKAGREDMEVFRGLMLPGAKVETEHTSRIDVGLANYRRLDDIKLARNGAASTTTLRKVANDWGGIAKTLPDKPQRVVLRAKVPRTAVLSIPVFGQNVHGEREVVVAGNRGKWQWDAWRDKAPDFESVPIK